MDKSKKLVLLLGLLSRAALGQPATAPPAGVALTLNPCYDLAEAHHLTLARLREPLHRLPLLQGQVKYQPTGSAPAPSR